MKAVVLNEYGGPEVLKIVERDIPVPGQGEVLLRMETAGVGKPDVLMRTGTYPWTKGMLPFYPGLYGAGIVAGLGEGVEGLSVGQRVFIDHPIACSCYSEYKLAPAERAIPLPAGTDPAGAAVITNYLIGWAILSNMCIPHQDKTLYIKGAAGGLGTAIIQLAPKKGIRVIASASTPEKCAYLESLGTPHVFCYQERDELEAVMEFTGGRGVDYLMDQYVGERFASQVPLLAKCGTIIVYNTLGGYPEENVVKLLTDHFARCIGVRAFSFHLYDDDPAGLAALRGEVFDLLARGEICPRIAAEFPQAEVAEAHRLLESGKAGGAIILRIS